MWALIAALKTKLLLGNGPASQQATTIMLYQEQKQTVVEKRADVERLHRYAIRERLRAGMNMNKIHLAHFCHRWPVCNKHARKCRRWGT